MERLFREEEPTKDMWQAHKKAAGSIGQDSEQLLKARLPTLLTELIPLDRKGKGPGREADLLSLPSWWILYECSFMMGRMVMWAPLIFIMYQSQPPVIDSKSIHKSLTRGHGEESVSLLGIWMESFFQRVTSSFYQAISPRTPRKLQNCFTNKLNRWARGKHL